MVGFFLQYNKKDFYFMTDIFGKVQNGQSSPIFQKKRGKSLSQIRVCGFGKWWIGLVFVGGRLYFVCVGEGKYDEFGPFLVCASESQWKGFSSCCAREISLGKSLPRWAG